MKKILLSIVALSFTAVTFAQNLKNNMDTVSYSLGVLFAQNFKNGEKINIDANAMAKGFQDAIAGTETIKVEQANQLFSQYMAEASKSKFTATVEAGKKFLDENAKRPGVKVTASGLQYEVMVDGTGVIPKATDKVRHITTVHY